MHLITIPLCPTLQLQIKSQCLHTIPLSTSTTMVVLDYEVDNYVDVDRHELI